MTHNLIGIHHVTAMTNDAERNFKFITDVLGMRLVKKTVNQDDIHSYHTFFADDLGSPGTDLTFFDFPNNPRGIKGTNSISRIGLRVPSDAALDYYLKRFEEFGVKHEGIQELFGKKILPFEEQDGQGQQGQQGYGEVHHVAFRVADHDAIKVWEAKYNELGLRHSGWVDRFFFEALYVRVGHILIELSTDGPGFMGDEPYETLGESLSLPPFLEGRREEIEATIRPFDTSRKH